jgi:hypothetical protein
MRDPLTEAGIEQRVTQEPPPLSGSLSQASVGSGVCWVQTCLHWLDCGSMAARTEASMSTASQVQPVLVKRYARTRLYDPANNRYVSVEQLRGWAAKGVIFSVIDMETGADITRVLLA